MIFECLCPKTAAYVPFARGWCAFFLWCSVRLVLLRKAASSLTLSCSWSNVVTVILQKKSIMSTVYSMTHYSIIYSLHGYNPALFTFCTLSFWYSITYAGLCRMLPIDDLHSWKIMYVRSENTGRKDWFTCRSQIHLVCQSICLLASYVTPDLQ